MSEENGTFVERDIGDPVENGRRAAREMEAVCCKVNCLGSGEQLVFWLQCNASLLTILAGRVFRRNMKEASKS